jgi:hypothetical protein
MASILSDLCTSGPRFRPSEANSFIYVNCDAQRALRTTEHLDVRNNARPLATRRI